jgi:ADP-ribose pyrophosphatase YjhB (NUDIX family)
MTSTPSSNSPAKQFCRSCGGVIAAHDGVMRCDACGMQVFENPIPVVVALVPVRAAAGTGLLVLRRGIEPGRGKLALPGGFLELEPWQQGLSREVREEVGFDLPPDGWVPFGFASSDPRPNRLLVFAVCPPVDAAAIPAFVPNPETEAVGIVYQAEGLEALMAFPLHLAQIRRFLACHKSAGPGGFHPLDG